MTPPDEVVCETEAAFRDACWKYGAFVPGCAIKACEEAHGWKDVRVPVRIVYRPPAPKPEWVRYWIPGWMGSAAHWSHPYRVAAWPHDGCARLVVDGQFMEVEKWEACDPPPRDEGREAFEKWWASDLNAPPSSFMESARQTAFYRAFLAGRASVKP